MPAPSLTWLQLDGTWHPKASLPVTDRAVRYGMSVFETIGISHGNPLFLSDHFDLLTRSARVLFKNDALVIPPDLPALTSDASGVLRLYITAGDGSPTAPILNPRFFSIFESLSSASLPDFQSARIHPSPFTSFAGGMKTANYWAHCDAQADAHAAGFDHAVLCNHDGAVLSTGFGNIFYVSDGCLMTPPLSLSVRPGTIRAWVLQQMDVVEKPITKDLLPGVSEIFLTNSRLGVMPLSLDSILPGPVGIALRDSARRRKIIPCSRIS